MNPSASGWIKKHLPTFQKTILEANYTPTKFYEKLQLVGFIYANSVKTISYPSGTTYELTLEELSKINLFDALAFVYYENQEHPNPDSFIANAIAFYAHLEKHSWFSFKIPGFKNSNTTKLEKILEQRIQLDESRLQRNFGSLIANALLYLDVLAFKHFLKAEGNPAEFAKSLEALLANTVFLAFQEKSKKSDHEKLMLKLLQTSLRYNEIEETSRSFHELDYSLHKNPLERQYILDLACLTIYSDEHLEENEHQFIERLGKSLEFNTEEIEDSIAKVISFLKTNREKITYFDYSNPIRHLYKNTNRMVCTLILRNKSRLSKEISQSRELVVLLRKSTSTELNDTEKAKVKTQLLDICKTVPSLAIFLLPGGSILLPILIKFIPELLPSAFNDNR